MSRLARVVAVGLPHHVTQRGNGQQTVFDTPADRHVYLHLLQKYSEKYRLRVWAWCLMTNHVHVLGVPEEPNSLARTIGHTDCEYARYRNARLSTSGHLWQARYYSCAVEPSAVWVVMAYIEQNPVRAGLAELPEQYPYSSARVHVGLATDTGLLDLAVWRAEYTPVRWTAALRVGRQEEAWRERLRQAAATGRPFGSPEFQEAVEHRLNRRLRVAPPGRPKKVGGESARQLHLEIGV